MHVEMTTDIERENDGVANSNIILALQVLGLNSIMALYHVCLLVCCSIGWINYRLQQKVIPLNYYHLLLFLR